VTARTATIVQPYRGSARREAITFGDVVGASGDNERMRTKPDELRVAAQAWDVEDDAGPYRDDPPLPFVAGFDVVLACRLSQTWRVPPERGPWSQWEAI
jgi:hypothetical protein